MEYSGDLQCILQSQSGKGQAMFAYLKIDFTLDNLFASTTTKDTVVVHWHENPKGSQLGHDAEFRGSSNFSQTNIDVNSFTGVYYKVIPQITNRKMI